MKWFMYMVLALVLALVADRWDIPSTVLSFVAWIVGALLLLLLPLIRFHRVPESEWWVVERLGKAIHRIGGHPHVLRPGLNITFRWIDKIVKSQSIQERATDTEAQKVMAGGIEIDINGVLYWRIGRIDQEMYPDGKRPDGELAITVDPWDVYWATYGLTPGQPDPLEGVKKFANSTLRNVVGRVPTIDFDKLEDAQKDINESVREEMNPAMTNWGLVVLRHEITNLLPSDPDLRKKLQEPLRAQKERAARIQLAEAEEQELRIRAEGRRQEETIKAEAQRAAADNIKGTITTVGQGMASIAEPLKGLHPIAQVAAIVLSSPSAMDLMDAMGEGLRPSLPRPKGADQKDGPSPPPGRQKGR